jgi:polysaccharide biosynthesis transport protein
MNANPVMNANPALPFSPLAEPDLGYGQLFAVLLRQRWWVISAILVGLAIGGALGLREKPIFTSAMQLQVEPNYRSKNAAANTSEFADTQVEVDTITQMNLMQSSNLLRRAMDKLKSQYPELDPSDPANIIDFKKALSVTQVTSQDKAKTPTKIFQITYNDLDAVKSQRVLEAVKGVYIAYNLEQQKARLDNGLRFVKTQIPKVSEEVNRAEKLLEKFRKEQGVIDPAQQSLAISAALNQIAQEQVTTRTQLQELQRRSIELQQRIGMSQQQAILASRLTQSPRYQTMLAEIQKTELILAQQLTRFQPGTPQVDQVLTQRDQQLSLLQTEVSRVVGTTTRSGEALLSSGQMGELDLGLITQMINTQLELQGITARYQNLVIEEQRLQTELKRFPQLLAAYGRLQPEIDLKRETLKQLLRAEQDIGLEINRGGFEWQVVEAPQLTARSDSGLKRNLLLGGVVGLFLGGGVAFAREAVDDAVHNSEELTKQSSLPLLGLVPELRLYDSEPMLPFVRGQRLTMDINRVLQWQPFRESLDLLYQNIQLLDGPPLRSIVVTSALAGEGKSTLALGLAVSAARLHQRVLLIDGDLRRSSIHKLLNLPNDKGLSNILVENLPLPDHLLHRDPALEASGRGNISVLTAGPSPADPAKCISSPRMAEMMRQLEEVYDLVIVDAPPVLGIVDAMLAASCCSATLLVGRLDYVHRSELTQAISSLSKLKVIGVVANGDPDKSLSTNAVYREA